MDDSAPAETTPPRGITESPKTVMTKDQTGGVPSSPSLSIISLEETASMSVIAAYVCCGRTPRILTADDEQAHWAADLADWFSAPPICISSVAVWALRTCAVPRQHRGPVLLRRRSTGHHGQQFVFRADVTVLVGQCDMPADLAVIVVAYGFLFDRQLRGNPVAG